ncbi:unnamed protein product, partial [Effrenium voratum]
MEGFVEESGWPCVDKQARRVECVSEFMDFVCSGDHSKGHICTLSDGIAKLKLDASIPATLLQACRGKSSSVEAVLEAIQQEGGPWTGELFWWPPGESHREEVCGDDLGDKLLRYRPFSEPCYVAELRGAERLPRGSHELTDTLTSVDVKDSGPRLPFWDRGHGFVGAAGSGLGLHVDQIQISPATNAYMACVDPTGLVEQHRQELLGLQAGGHMGPRFSGPRHLRRGAFPEAFELWPAEESGSRVFCCAAAAGGRGLPQRRFSLLIAILPTIMS